VKACASRPVAQPPRIMHGGTVHRCIPGGNGGIITVNDVLRATGRAGDALTILLGCAAVLDSQMTTMAMPRRPRSNEGPA
jgi:hypothetical protein